MKILLLSHEGDIDGLGNVVLAKLAFDNLEYHLFTTPVFLEKKFREMLENDSLSSYDMIFITDLALESPSLELVAQTPHLAAKVRVLDHHTTAIENGFGIYSFTKIEECREDGHKRCGTEMFYEYLTEHGLLKKTPILDDFTELTRLEDTWEWKGEGNRGLKAHDMAILLSGLGVENYIDAMYNKVTSQNQTVEFNEDEQNLIASKKREYEMTLQNLWENTEILTDEFKNRFGIVYADYEYRNELAEYIRKLADKKDIEYIVIVSLEKGVAGQKSYRSIDENFDVNEIATLHGGGGHSKAAGVNITEEQKAKSLTLPKKEGLEYLAKSKYTD